jgi:hypothetical protein
MKRGARFLAYRRAGPGSNHLSAVLTLRRYHFAAFT